MLHCYCTTCNKFTETFTFMDEDVINVAYLYTCEACANRQNKEEYINEEDNSLSTKEIEDYAQIERW